MAIELLKTNSKNTDFIEVIQLLDKDLSERYGEFQKQYDKHLYNWKWRLIWLKQSYLILMVY